MKSNYLNLLFEQGMLVSLSHNGKELIKAPSPLFRICLRGRNGDKVVFSADEAADICEKDGFTVFSGFPFDITVALHFDTCGNKIEVYANIKNNTEFAIEWIILLPLILNPLYLDGGEEGTELLLPYNEGLLLNSIKKIPDILPEYPSSGGCLMFPNMMFAQTASYLYKNNGNDCYLNICVPDETRAPKEITVRNNELIFKLFCGADYSFDVTFSYPLVLRCGEGGWERSCDEYREWFALHLPGSVKKLCDNYALPEWYNDNVIVVTYPVRGIHDMDKMEPNAYYPYMNAYPIISEIKEKTGMRPLVLLMHWEGTAPWAPPYVWPPYGDIYSFFEFLKKLHDSGCLLGVYCSGFGYTEKSNLICDYDNKEKINKEELYNYFCAAPDGKVELSRICTAQRSGYDICPACDGGKAILNDAYSPLFSSGIDYAQILDQNHGGGQYFCYSDKHGHAPVPGGWMTEKMQDLLSEWNKDADKMLLGCESAAAEPFIGNLLFSDNRYELCYDIGRPVPMYAYIFHEYLHNFMGNQVCCYFPQTTDALLYRIAYSFAAGDAPTLVLTPDGQINPAWGTRDFSELPDKEEVLSFIKTLNNARENVLAPYLNYGKMIPAGSVICDNAPFGNDLPSVIASAFEYNGNKITILINPFEIEKECTVCGKKNIIKGRSILYTED